MCYLGKLWNMESLKLKAANEKLELGVLWYSCSVCMIVLFLMYCFMRYPEHHFFFTSSFHSANQSLEALLADC